MRKKEREEEVVVSDVTAGGAAVAETTETADNAAVARELSPEEIKQSKKQSRVAKASFVWTILSMIFAIASACFYLYKNWLIAPYSYIMLGVMGVYVIVFAVMIGLYAGNAKQGKKKIKGLKKAFGIFRSFTTLVFLIATAVSMTGVISTKGLGLWQWIVLGVNISVAIVQVSLKITLLVFSAVAKKVGQQYTVKITSYVNGVAKDNKVQSKVMSKLYGTEVHDDAPKTEQPTDEAAKVRKEEAKAAKAAAKEELKAAAVKFTKEAAREQAVKAAARIEELKARAAGKQPVKQPEKAQPAAAELNAAPAADKEVAEKAEEPATKKRGLPKVKLPFSKDDKTKTE